jgi:hypothetical protein
MDAQLQSELMRMYEQQAVGGGYPASGGYVSSGGAIFGGARPRKGVRRCVAEKKVQSAYYGKPVRRCNMYLPKGAKCERKFIGPSGKQRCASYPSVGASMVGGSPYGKMCLPGHLGRSAGARKAAQSNPWIAHVKAVAAQKYGYPQNRSGYALALSDPETRASY